MKSLVCLVVGCALLLPTTVQADIVVNSIQDYDGYIWLYEGVFDPNDPVTNLVAENDDGFGGVGTSDLTYDFAIDNTSYTLVTGGFFGDAGTFTNTISGSSVAGPIVYNGDLINAPDGIWNDPTFGSTGPYQSFKFSTTGIPEPGALAALAIGGLTLILRRRR